MTLGARFVGLYALVCVAGVVLAPVAAHADVDTARAHYAAGERALAQGDAVRAVGEFRAAYRAQAAPKTLLAIAVAYERAGDEPAAAAYYWWYLNSGAASATEQTWLFPKIVELSGEGARVEPAVAVRATRPAAPPVSPGAPVRPAPDPDRPLAALEEARPTKIAPAPEAVPPARPAQEPDDEAAPEPELTPEPEPEAIRPPRPRPQAATRPRWYGLPLLIAEGACFGAVVGGIENNNEGAVVLGGIGIVLSGPIVHFYYGHGTRGWGSFGLRLAGAGIGGLAGEGTGALVGYLGALAVDAFLVARDEVPVEPAVVPTVSARDGGVSLGLAGRF